MLGRKCSELGFCAPRDQGTLSGHLLCLMWGPLYKTGTLLPADSGQWHWLSKRDIFCKRKFEEGKMSEKVGDSKRFITGLLAIKLLPISFPKKGLCCWDFYLGAAVCCGGQFYLHILVTRTMKFTEI